MKLGSSSPSLAFEFAARDSILLIGSWIVCIAGLVEVLSEALV